MDSLIVYSNFLRYSIYARGTDELLTELTEQGYEVIGFTDDLVIMIRGNDGSILSILLLSAQNHAMKWCKGANLCINPIR
jgi:hypothetical protein